jgi:hypothetical protein
LSWQDATCDFSAMARDRAFLSAFADNMRRFNAYASSVTARQSEILASLGSTIASGLATRSVEGAAQ